MIENPSGKPWIVDFYAPWCGRFELFYFSVHSWVLLVVRYRCGHCKKLMPEWSMMATNLKGIANAGSVDATAHKSCTNRYEVRGYPSVKLFLDNGKRVVDFKGTRTAAEMETFVKKMLQPAVETLNDSGDLKRFVESNAATFVLAGDVSASFEASFKNASIAFQRDTWFGRIKVNPSI